MRYSVIIPVYNVEKYLERCLDSVVTQDYNDFEVIIVDDGSTDESGEICDRYAKEYDNIRVIHQSNMGLSGARNTGIKNSGGEYILFLDSDDQWTGDFWEVVESATRSYDADFYKFNYIKTFDEREPEKRPIIIENEFVDLSFDEDKTNFYFERLLTYKVGWEVCTGIYKREILDKYDIKFVDTKKIFAEDLLFTMEYIIHAARGYLICNYLYYYFTRADSLITKADDLTILPRLFCLFENFRKQCKERKMIKKYDYMLFFQLIDYHVNHNLKNLEIGSIREQIGNLSGKRPYRQLIKAVKRHTDDLKMTVKREWI